MADVIVHTSLPPDVEGPITGYLYLHIPFIIWEKNFKNHINEVIYIKVLWWGEKSNGSIFFPSNIQRNEAYIMPRTVARYEIRSAPLQFSSYLKDMETINLQVLSSATVIGIAVVNVSTLKQDASIVGKFPVISSSQVKIAELQVKITIYPVKEHITSTLGRNRNIKQSEDNGKSSLNHYHRIMKYTADDPSESSDLVTLLLERAKSLREAMIVSLLQSRSLEKFLQNENTKHINENNQEDLIENILGGSQKKKVINQDQNIVDVSDSSSSSNSQLADLNESLDSLPDDSVINELFYKDKSVQELSPTMHKFHKNYQYKIKPISKSSENRSKVELPENDSHYNSNTHLSSEIKSVPENVKSIKVKIKNIKFKFSQKSSHNSVATLLEQNKLRTYILELIPPFSAEVKSWDHRGHRMHYSDNLQFISRRIKNGVVIFNQEVNITCKKSISVKELLSKELIFTAKARMHDIHKIVNLGSGGIKIKDIISARSMCTVCSLSLKDITKNVSEKSVNEKYSNESILEVEVSLITSRINVHHSESSTSSKTLSKTQFNENEITDISKNDETESGKNETHTNNIDDVSKSKEISEDSPDFYKNLIINDVLYCLLQISDGRNFGKKKWLHVVFRLFFSKSGFFRDILYDPEQPQFCFTQIFPVLLNDELLQSTNNNIMVIEIWERNDQKSEQKKLRGLCKLPLHCFYLVFNNSALAKSHLLSKFPVISTSGYTPVVHPITNHCNGELNILFALGTLVQIENAIEKYSQIESENKNEAMTEFKNTVNKEKIGLNEKLHKSNNKEIKHFIEFSIESLGDLEINKDLIWGEAECYMTYCFPSQYKDNMEICLFKSDIQLLIPNLAFQHKMKHTYILKENENICNILLKEFTSQKNEDSILMKQLPIKLWGSFYNPYQRIELLASTYLLLNDVCSFIQTDTTDSEEPIYKTYKLPFQTNFTNSTRLKVDHIKINLKYWKGDANMGSRFTENDHNNTNKTNNTSVHSALEADHSVQLDLIEILEDPSLEKSLEVNGKNDVVTNLPKNNNECTMEKPEKDASVSNKTYSKNLVAKHNYSDINSGISDMPFCSKNNDFVFYTHIFIERALHLPMVMKKERISISPSPYVTFNINNEESFYTNIVNNNCSPVWDWHQNVSFKMISKNQEMNLVFKIWHAADEHANSPNSTADRVLGFASVDFSLLFHGLNQISGWYNVMDINGKCQGQIKISIIAQNKEMFQECTNCVIQERDWNNSQIITLDSKQLSETTQEINNFVHKSLKEHMNELDLLYSQLMKRLADVSSPVKVFGGLAASKFEKEGTGKEISNVPNDEIFSSLSLQCINLTDNKDKVKAGNQTLCDIHQYSLVEGSIIEHDNTPEAIIPSTNCPSITESCVFVREQKFIPTLAHSKCISASLLHSSVEQEDVQCHYCNEFRLTKKIISDKDAGRPVDANLSTQLKGNAVSKNRQGGQAKIETLSSGDDANKQS